MATYFRRVYLSFAEHVLDVPPRLLASMIFLILLAYPITKPPLTILYVLSVANIMAIFAASWDLLVGRTGQMNLGHALFFGTAAYATALFCKFFNLQLWVTIPLGALIGVSVALIIGFPCLRVKGPYLALVTLTFPLILISVVKYFREITGGEEPIINPRFFPGLPMYGKQLADYYLTLALLFVSGVILYKIANSRMGIVMVSILDNELASKACGINVTKYKLLAFAISGLFGSLAGAFMTHMGSGASVNYNTYLGVALSFQAIIIAIFGGVGTIYGPIAAAYILVILDMYGLGKIFGWFASNNLIPASIIQIESSMHWIMYTLVIIILIIKWPRGIGRFTTDKLKDLQEARELEERGKHIWKTYKRKKEESEHASTRS